MTINFTSTMTVNNKFYGEVEGVTLGKQFLNKEDFIDQFKDMLKQSGTYQNFKLRLDAIKQKINQLNNANNMPIKNAVISLEDISNDFSQLMGGLGGDISLLTSFNFSRYKTMDMYFLTNEKDLSLSIDPETHGAIYNNTKKELEQLIEANKGVIKINNAFVQHMQNYQNEITLQGRKNEYIELMSWSYYFLKERYKVFENRKKDSHYPSLAHFIWGKSTSARKGYVQESFGTHMALQHPNFLNQENLSFSNSVVNEHGGRTSHSLYNLMASAKGNVASQLSGDIVVLDKNGQITVNIQSKATARSEYLITIKYKKFFESINKFCNIYDRYFNNGNFNTIADKDAEILFNSFKSKAWSEIDETLYHQLTEESNKLINEFASKF